MSVDKALSIIDALMIEPRTVFDLCIICDVHKDTAREYVRMLRGAGRLEFDGFGEANGPGTRPSRWRWVARKVLPAMEVA